MERITDYRTEKQKSRDAKYAQFYERFTELRAEGLSRNRSCEIVAQEYNCTAQCVRGVVKRLESQSSK